jgi:hypothetical protein
MKRIKKELPGFLVILLLGIGFVILASWNAKQYDKKHPYQKISTYYQYEIQNHR